MNKLLRINNVMVVIEKVIPNVYNDEKQELRKALSMLTGLYEQIQCDLGEKMISENKTGDK